LRNAFSPQSEYWLRKDEPPGPTSPNGFQQQPDDTTSNWEHFGLATVLPVEGSLQTATDDWPFLYLRKPMIPTLSLRGMLIMGGLGLLLILLFLPRQGKTRADSLLNIQMFFLGAGFMLIETKAVVTMALLFGGTWIVNSVVFIAVLVMILLANLWTLRLRPTRLWPYYTGLLISLGLNVIVPLDSFLGMSRGIQVLGSCLLVFVPIFFAGVIFAASFKRTMQPDRAFGINVAGAMVGGLAEYGSMALGFQYVVLIAILFYALSGTAQPQRH